MSNLRSDQARKSDNAKGACLAEPANQNVSSAPSILIILMGSLGDIARGLCLVTHIKANLPGSRVTWLVEPKWKDLVRCHPQIDKVIVFKRAWRISALWDLYKDLHQEHFDITLDLQRIIKSGFFSLLSGADRRIGFHPRNAKEWNWIFNNEHINYQNDDLAKIRHYLKFSEYLGLPEPNTLDFGFSALSVSANAPGIVIEQRDPFVAVIMGASWESKEWLFEGYVKLVQRILSVHQLGVILVGDRSQRAAANILVEKMHAPNLINLVGQTSLLELTAILKAAVAAVGPDSGPGHLAAAVNTPFVALFGPTSPKRTAPFGFEHLVVNAEISCAPCYKRKCPERDKRCMTRIKVEDIVEKISKVL